jgi:predicted amidohydrolase YtcJ
MRRSAVLLSLALLSPVVAAEDAVDVTLLHAARIHTGDPDRPLATAMAWDTRGRLLAVGDEATLQRQFPQARLLAADGRDVVPGLIDAHAHLMNLGYALLRADLVGAASKQEVIQRLQAFMATVPADAWLLGRGWDQNDWPDKEFPTAADLDAAFPDRPVWLERVDGHAAWANSAAMRAVPRDLSGDWQPDGGRILRDAAGKPTGIFVDGAALLVEAVVPPASDALRREALRRALQAAVAHGLTGVHDMGVSLADLQLMRELADKGLPLRIRAYADGDGAALAALCAMGPYEHGGGRLTMRGVKFYIDGALGSRGAVLLADYSDEPGHRGLLLTEPAAFLAGVRKARDCGLQPASHAIGDRGVRIVLDTYQQALAEVAGAGVVPPLLPNGRDHRWRVEHAQVIAPQDFARLASLGLVASMQPTHATSDMPWAQERIGSDRLQGAYAWQRLRDAGVALALGSDFPVESVDPRLGLYAAVSRQDRAGQPKGGWMADQRLTPAQALDGFTAGAAFAAFDDAELGRLMPGYRADFVILGGDPLTVPVERLPELGVLSTWVDGVQVYDAAAPGVGD